MTQGALLNALWRPTCESEQTQGESEEGKPGVLQFMRSQRAGHHLATEQCQQMGRKSKKRGATCIPMADSLCCPAETDTVAHSKYTPIFESKNNLPTET